MKAKKIIMAALCCFSVFSLVSCNLNDDDNGNTGLSPIQIKTAYTAVKDIHSGKLVYTPLASTGSSSKNDTINISWDISTDSTMTIHNFPVSALADNITSSNYSDLKTALENVNTTDLSCFIGFYQLNPISFLINPISPSFNLSYGGATHKIQIAFYLNTTYSAGIYDYQNNGILEMQIIEAGIYIDGSQSSALSTSKAFLIDSTK